MDSKASNAPATSKRLPALFSLSILAIALLSGGPEWFAVCLVAFFALRQSPLRESSIPIATLPGFVWLGFSGVTDNRELYFPFTVYLATLTGLAFSRRGIWRGTLVGLLLVSVFMIARCLQAAPPMVLLLEFGVALAILQFSLIAYLASRRTFVGGITVSAIASILAFASLAL